MRDRREALRTRGSRLRGGRMSLVRPICAVCGAKTEVLAVVMDPFMDSCYGVCQSCMADLHGLQFEQIKAALDLTAEAAAGRLDQESQRR